MNLVHTMTQKYSRGQGLPGQTENLYVVQTSSGGGQYLIIANAEARISMVVCMISLSADHSIASKAFKSPCIRNAHIPRAEVSLSLHRKKRKKTRSFETTTLLFITTRRPGSVLGRDSSFLWWNRNVGKERSFVERVKITSSSSSSLQDF